ncbi:hypothetical protein, partial [Vibrio parahaemolyticus]|uniref:hypothetical protein n=1 Tax=Vibrio parahaemolyticus TaxID=670 RepID=UPI001C5F65F6
KEDNINPPTTVLMTGCFQNDDFDFATMFPIADRQSCLAPQTILLTYKESFQCLLTCLSNSANTPTFGNISLGTASITNKY